MTIKRMPCSIISVDVNGFSGSVQKPQKQLFNRGETLCMFPVDQMQTNAVLIQIQLQIMRGLYLNRLLFKDIKPMRSAH